ncbi:MAG: hypothetical protein ACRDUW_20490 [Pseudonocardiaceae bacterium]
MKHDPARPPPPTNSTLAVLIGLDPLRAEPRHRVLLPGPARRALLVDIYLY